MKELLKKFSQDYDPYLVLALAFLCLIGLLGIYSATYKGGISSLFIKQVIYLTLGWFIIFFLSRFDFRSLYELAPVIYFLNLFLLVLVPLLGKTVYGAKRWLDLGPINLQPSELFKFSFALFAIYTVSHIKKFLSKESVLLFLSFVIPATLTLKQPDLGTTISYAVILVLLLFLWGVKLKYFALAGFTFLIFSPLLWHLLRDYQKARILAVLDPYADYQGSGYQIVQSIIAVGSGGFFGKGLLQGTQAHLLFLPEKHTDFIFSVIAEEWGFSGSLLLFSAVFFIFYRLVQHALTVPNPVERAFLGTFAGLWLFQSSVNLMMTIGWAPVVGIPLPFVSYGGSSVLTFSLFFGFAFSIIREYRSKPIKFEGG